MNIVWDNQCQKSAGLFFNQLINILTYSFVLNDYVHLIFRLYFWIYRPHVLLYKYFTICLFDDHGVDNIKVVTMSQWKSNPRILIVHGSGGSDGEDSYISFVAVPKLNCLDCKKLRDEFNSESIDGEYRFTGKQNIWNTMVASSH